MAWLAPCLKLREVPIDRSAHLADLVGEQGPVHFYEGLSDGFPDGLHEDGVQRGRG